MSDASGAPLIELQEGGQCIARRRCQDGKTRISLGYDLFGEAQHLLTVGQPAALAQIPTLDIHLDILRTWMLEAGIALREIPPVPANGAFFACLTHDVDFAAIRNHRLDRTALGFLYRASVGSARQYLAGHVSRRILLENWMALMRLPAVHMGLADDFWVTFRKYRALEGDAPSTFFFVPFKGKPGRRAGGPAPAVRAVKYEVADHAPDLRFLRSQGCEIGVHGIDSWTDVEEAQRERSKLLGLSPAAAMGIRMHWLYFDAASPGILERAGYAFDSTVGYNEAVGYKAGTASVYKPLGAQRLLELPLHVMDTALFYPDRMNLTLPEGEAAIGILIQNARHFGGALTFNWHDRSIAPERCWDGVYQWTLSELRHAGARFLTAGDTVAWFRRRRSVTFADSNEAPVEVPPGAEGCGSGNVPPMALRIYQPSAHPLEAPAPMPTIWPFRDTPLSSPATAGLPTSTAAGVGS